MWTEHFAIEWRRYRVGIRADERASADWLLDRIGAARLDDGPASYHDLSIDLGLDQGAKRPILSLRHGERAVVRTRSRPRLQRAVVNWLDGLTTTPDGPTLGPATACAVSEEAGSASVTLFPRFASADLALLERLAPDGAHWLDSPWIQFIDGGVAGPDGVRVGAVTGIVIDGGTTKPDLSTSARCALALIAYLRAGEPVVRLDLASDLALSVGRWDGVTTEDHRVACRTIADVISGS